MIGKGSRPENPERSRRTPNNASVLNPGCRTARTAETLRREPHSRSRKMGKETIQAKARRTAEILLFQIAAYTCLRRRRTSRASIGEG